MNSVNLSMYYFVGGRGRELIYLPCKNCNTRVQEKNLNLNQIFNPDFQISSYPGSVTSAGLNISLETQCHYQGNLVCDIIGHLLTN